MNILSLIPAVLRDRFNQKPAHSYRSSLAGELRAAQKMDEDAALQAEACRQSKMTADARALAQLSEGFTNRLPSLCHQCHDFEQLWRSKMAGHKGGRWICPRCSRSHVI